MKACIVVPHYDHFEQFERFLPDLAAAGLPLIVVDDASPDESVCALENLLEQAQVDATLIRHKQNEGKGGAVITALRAAEAAGFTHALQVDADGQHDSAAVPTFIRAGIDRPDALICGVPVFDDSVSRLRLYARYISLWFVQLESLSLKVRDAMCGFRLYPLATINPIFDRVRFGRNMAFDCEILVRASWAGIPVSNIPVAVSYPVDGKSHFHYFRDNVDISWMHTRLLIGMLFRLPVLLGRKLAGMGTG